LGEILWYKEHDKLVGLVCFYCSIVDGRFIKVNDNLQWKCALLGGAWFWFVGKCMNSSWVVKRFLWAVQYCRFVTVPCAPVLLAARWIGFRSSAFRLPSLVQSISHGNPLVDALSFAMLVGPHARLALASCPSRLPLSSERFGALRRGATRAACPTLLFSRNTTYNPACVESTLHCTVISHAALLQEREQAHSHSCVMYYALRCASISCAEP